MLIIDIIYMYVCINIIIHENIYKKHITSLNFNFIEE